MSVHYISSKVIQTLKDNWETIFHPDMMLYKDSYMIPGYSFQLRSAESSMEESTSLWN